MFDRTEGIETSDTFGISRLDGLVGVRQTVIVAHPPSPPSPPAFLHWSLMLLAVVLTAVAIALGIHLFAAGQCVPPPATRKIVVPFASDVALWEGCRDTLRDPALGNFGQGWVVQEDGRNKPFDTFCRDTVRTITGRERFEGNEPIALVMSWLMLYDPDRNRSNDMGRSLKCDWDHYPFILCEFPPLRQTLYREWRGPDVELTEEQQHGKYVEPAMLRNSEALKRLLRDAEAKRAEDSKAPLCRLEEKAKEAHKRLELYEQTRSGESFNVAALDCYGSTWFSLKELRDIAANPEHWAELMNARAIEHRDLYQGKERQPCPVAEVKEILASHAALEKDYRAQDRAEFARGIDTFRETLDRAGNRFETRSGRETIHLELWYNRTNPFGKAWFASLLATVLLAASLFVGTWWRGVGRTCYGLGLLAYVAALVCAATGFWCRVTISGRAPVSNMYESIIWVAFMTAVFGLLLELVYRRAVIAWAGAMVSTLGFVLADQLPMTFSPVIQPLQAVLRSNYWLIIHVLTIVSSYAAFALAWGLGNLNLGLIVFAPERRDLIRTLSQFSYRAIQIGVVLIAAGTLLGGFWAAESWGRFWGWDPKEVWALIALLSYVIPLHARHAGWLKDFGLAVCSVVCFSSVVMAWYGVNFVLGAGLHSYGFGGGEDAWVYWAGIINIDLVVLAALRYRYHQQREAMSSAV